MRALPEAAALDALAAYRATGLAPEEVAALAARMDAAVRARLAVAEGRARLTAELRTRLGGLVAGLGGEVRADGSVVFRDALLFEAGSALIRPAFDETLVAFCRPWMTTLYEARDGLQTVRIEGHASSEWLPLEAPLAYERNLDLSQARAAAVFKRCLSHAGDDAVAAWARTRMSAVGFSSARPVLDEVGREDPIASRRVVFAIETRGPTDEDQAE
jgi:outer membrane protein OmpA-like peptidoglycan-associated protein